MQLKAARPRLPEYFRYSQWRIEAMNRISAFLPRLLRNEWRQIGTAPVDREIEVAVMDGDINVSGRKGRS
jgi:hypothetical protein